MQAVRQKSLSNLKVGYRHHYLLQYLFLGYSILETTFEAYIVTEPYGFTRLALLCDFLTRHHALLLLSGLSSTIGTHLYVSSFNHRSIYCLAQHTIY